MIFRILHTYKTYSPDPTGGVAEVMAKILSCLRDFENSVLVARAKGRGRTIVQDETTIRAVGSLGELSSMPIAPAYPLVLARAARTADVVVHHAPFPLADLGLLIPLPAHTGLIVYWHADVVRPNPLTRAVAQLSRHTLERADRIVVSHEAVIKNSAVLRPYAGKCTVIPFSVDAAYWSTLDLAQKTEASELRSRFPRLIVAAGRLVPYKGFDILLEALRAIDAQLIIIGTGLMRNELESKIKNFGLGGRVFLAGHKTRDQMKVIFHAARVFAFPSITPAEAFGLVQLEAMSAGLPVVNTALPTAVPHVARHELDGLTVAPRDIRGLAQALCRLLDDPQLAQRLGQTGRQRAEKDFSPDVFCQNTTRLFHEVLHERRIVS